mgnify:CR=1 FL=1
MCKQSYLSKQPPPYINRANQFDTHKCRPESVFESGFFNCGLPRCFAPRKDGCSPFPNTIVPGLRSTPPAEPGVAARAQLLALGIQQPLETFGHLPCAVRRPARSGTGRQISTSPRSSQGLELPRKAGLQSSRLSHTCNCMRRE